MESIVIKKTVSQLLERKIIGLEKLGGGRNSRVYKVSCAEGVEFVAKVYHQQESDTRPRQETEFRGLRFLWDFGIRSIPQPIVLETIVGLSVFEFIRGSPILPSCLDSSDVEQAASFLLELKNASNWHGSASLPVASEAFFSIESVLANITFRMKRLMALQLDPVNEYFHKFLNYQLIQAIQTVETWSRTVAECSGIEFAKELPNHKKTLSPSDFGFHNAIKQADGRIVFLDFEYFGWDDPAKMISDFMLHPAMTIPNHLMQQFFSKMIRGLGNRELLNRIRILFPLLGIKWCLILLNEFLPDQFTRRAFADDMIEDRRALQDQQLEKAQIMLERTLNEYENFVHYYC